jgi:hypothetical protein
MPSVHHTYVDFKALTAQITPDLLLWIKFMDNNERTFKNISFPSTLAQMYFGKMPVKASVKHVWDTYNRLLDIEFKGKFRIARIYSQRSKGAEDYIVQYTSSGEVQYRDKGKTIEHCRLDFDDFRICEHEQRLETEVRVFINEIKSKHGKK